ncbi:ABC transporter ATP-binding protein [Phaeodactylibacter luteus]|uniref:ABC transporter ATP-binding protein n=1 Tax=Phaeodactylibacter luteus TaxID=1564516 RepID=A0A5C6RT98_9BACT|nr:ABC transporter ATP-binding protein [Phaeodactylibacter luteus]TXB64880.1 ABC transporter ATP-binding protein [Phaeodactylibacter luteus]
MEERLLTVNQLETTFLSEQAAVNAVRGVSFFLNRGETLGIVGESGSGKSVTALSLMRLIPQPGQITGGEVLYHKAGQEHPVDLLQLPRKEMRSYRGKELAMIFQEPMSSLNPVYRCGDQVIEGMVHHLGLSKAEAKTRAMELLEEVQLPDPKRIFKAYPHQLSGGQKQRVMIAMAMSCGPGVLIADEPTTALDVTVQKAILELMQRLKVAKKASVIFISHDLGVVAEIADRVMVMYKGEIVEQGPVDELFRAPKHPYTKSLLACRPPLNYRVRRLPVVADFIGAQTTADGTVAVVAKDTDMGQLLKGARITAAEQRRREKGLSSRPPILEVEGLKTWFPAGRTFWGQPKSYIKAVDGVSFQVRPGETLGLVGESGCGKTTLGRSLLGLAPVREGSIRYKGQELVGRHPDDWKALRQEMQIIFQDPYASLNPRMTIGRAIMEPMEVHGLYGNNVERRDRALHLLETVSLEPSHFQRYPHEFSGGQRQRIAIARALALSPRFIICDESVSALDVSVQAQVLNLLMDLRERYKFTYIFISHDLSVVKFMSDRMIVMNQGKIVEEGLSDELYNAPKADYTRMLINAIPQGILQA